jgi:hypothetical protein
MQTNKKNNKIVFGFWKEKNGLDKHVMHKCRRRKYKNCVSNYFMKQIIFYKNKYMYS